MMDSEKVSSLDEVAEEQDRLSKSPELQRAQIMVSARSACESFEDPRVSELVEMGFTEAQARSSLRKTKGNKEFAVNLLLIEEQEQRKAHSRKS